MSLGACCVGSYCLLQNEIDYLIRDFDNAL